MTTVFSSQVSHTPSEIYYLLRCIQLFCLESGEIYSCGHGEQGQLGLGGLANKLAPTRIEAQEISESGKGSSIACGYSLFLFPFPSSFLYLFFLVHFFLI